MLHKIIPPGAYKYERPVAEAIKIAHDGLRGSDLRDFIKVAGYRMADALRTIKFGPGEVPIHLLAVGATEFYGPNRNGDGFDEDVCRECHPSFVKYARWYRNHQNKDPKKSYGLVKYSHYNEDMHRIELLVALNGTKEAAVRNGGLLADREMEKIARHDPNWGVSMACRVPFDVCSGCGHQSRTKAEYCTEEMCKYGGLKNNITKVAEDGHFLHAKNPGAKFIDMSDVWRPADHIAYVLGCIEKAAAAGEQQLCGAELAERMGVTSSLDSWLPDVTNRRVYAQLKLATVLAGAEKQALDMVKFAGAWQVNVQPPVDLAVLSSAELPRTLRALADANAMLPVRDFLRAAHGMPLQKAASVASGVRPRLGEVFSRLVDTPQELIDAVEQGTYRPCACVPSRELSQWAYKVAADCSLDQARTQRRAWLSTLRPVENAVPCQGETEASLEKYAREYALYQLAFLDSRALDRDFALTSNMVIRHNQGISASGAR